MVTKERLDAIIKALGLSGRAFEKACGLANGSYSSIGDGVGADKLNKILVRFPQISAEWLLTGRGGMFKAAPDEAEPCEEPAAVTVNNDEAKEILFKMAGLVSGQQQDLSRLITELQRNGERSDRVLSLIEYESGLANRGSLAKKLYSK